jgi:putative DNA primase/helicase
VTHPTADDARRRIAERLEEADLDPDRFIDVADGSKATRDHTHRSADALTGNYGIHAKATDCLVLADVDEYDDEEAAAGALAGLPPTLTQQSPHGGEHALFRIDVDSEGRLPAAVFADEFDTKNPHPSWGEIRVANQYVVGAGSQLAGCDKEWCDACDEPDGGCYRIKDDRAIATVDAETFVDVLQQDPDLAPGDDADDADRGASDGPDLELDDETLVEKAKSAENGHKFRALWRGDTSSHGNDHSRADAALCQHLAFWTGGDARRIDRLFRQSGLMREKWEREDYRERTIDHALGNVSDYYDPSAAEPDPPTVEPADAAEGDTDAPAAVSWMTVQDHYQEDGSGTGRWYAAKALEDRASWMYVVESETLWVYDDATGYYNPWGEERAAHLLERNLGTHYSRGEKAEIVDRIKARNQLHREELNARTHEEPLVCVGNGVLNIETGELSEHSPTYAFTRGVEHDWNPDAVPERALRFLRDVTKRDADLWTLVQQLGHGLMPGHPYKAFVVMFGPGDNGKSAVGRLFRRFVGDENAASVELRDFREDDFATGDLPGKMINVGDDLSGKKIRDVSMLKRLTGGDTLRANEKHKATFDFQNEAAMFFSGNEPPVFEEKTDALKGRLYPVHMPHRFTQENDGHADADPHLIEKIVADGEEMSGLLALAVQGARSLIETGGQFAMPESPAERMRMYEAASDPIRRFVMDYLEQGGADDVALKDDVYDVYARFCRADDERAAAKDVFKREISQQAVVDVENGRTRKYVDGEGRARCWKYLRFAEDAREHMPARLAERYFPDEEPAADDDDGDGDPPAETDDGLGASRLADVATDPTGYATVTAEVLTAEYPPHEDAPALRATVKDTSTAIDVVAWFDEAALEAGETVLLENAKVSEYEGTAQLVIRENVTTVSRIQQGVGHTPGATPEDGQGTLAEDAKADREAATDGGETADPEDGAEDTAVPVDAEGSTADATRLCEIVRSEGGDLPRGTLLSKAAERHDLAPDRAEIALDRATTDGRLIDDGGTIRSGGAR